MEITVLAISLLVFRILATRYLVRVLLVQRELKKKRLPRDIAEFRRDLHFLTIVLVLSNIPAIVLDVFFIMKGIGLVWIVASNALMLSIYAMANAGSMFIGALLLDRIYRNSTKVDQKHADSDHTLMNNE